MLRIVVVLLSSVLLTNVAVFADRQAAPPAEYSELVAGLIDPGVLATGCTAHPTGYPNCSCTASGAGSSCSSGANAASCSQGGNTTTCTVNQGWCTCNSSNLVPNFH